MITLSQIKRYIRLKKARNRPRPEYIKRALEDSIWLSRNYSPNDLRLYLNTLHNKLEELKNQRIEELENKLNRLRRL